MAQDRRLTLYGLEVEFRYTGQGNAFKGIVLDHAVIPTVEMLPELEKALEALLHVAETTTSAEYRSARETLDRLKEMQARYSYRE